MRERGFLKRESPFLQEFSCKKRLDFRKNGGILKIKQFMGICFMKIEEIARLAGVSASTVSRVFSHHPHVSAEVRERVLSVARGHAYHPRLSTRQRNVVIITPYSSIYPVQCCVEMILMALTRELPRRGFRLEVLPQDNLERLETIQFCAAAAIGAEPGDFSRWSERFATPLVIIDRDAEKLSPDLHLVRSDEAQGMELAIRHLHERGCRRIGCVIHGRPGTGNADLRRAAVAEALRKFGLPGGDTLIRFGEDAEYLEIIGKLLRHGIDGLFCPGGSGGILSAYALSIFNRKVPEEISLVASEQTFFSRYGTPPQTTITPDYAALAGAVAEVIEARLAGESAPQRRVFPYLLIPRESVREP